MMFSRMKILLQQTNLHNYFIKMAKTIDTHSKKKLSHKTHLPPQPKDTRKMWKYEDIPRNPGYRCKILNLWSFPVFQNGLMDILLIMSICIIPRGWWYVRIEILKCHFFSCVWIKNRNSFAVYHMSLCLYCCIINEIKNLCIGNVSSFRV